MKRCRTCGAQFPESWIVHGVEGACEIHGYAFCSDGCYNRYANTETIVTQSHIPTNKAKKASPFLKTVPVKWAKQAMFNITKFRQLDGEQFPPGSEDLYGSRD